MIRTVLIAGLLALSACAPKPTTCNAPPNIFESFMPKKTEDRMTVVPKTEPKAAPKYTPRPKKKKPVRVKPKPKPNAGPDLPYSCWQVRMGAAGKSKAELDALGRRYNLTPKQQAQARACLR